MKFFPIILLAIGVLAFPSCGSDDDTPAMICTQSDLVGVYTGIQSCDDDEPTDVPEPTTLTITANGASAIDFSYEDVEGTFSVSNVDPIPFDNCGFSISGTDGDITLSITATLVGNEMTFVETSSNGTESSACTIVATK